MNDSASNYNALEYHRSRSNSPFSSVNCIDFSYNDLEDCKSSFEVSKQSGNKNPLEISVILLANNLLQTLPTIILTYQNIHTLDISCNQFKQLPIQICKLASLRKLLCKENFLGDSSLPKEFGESMSNLEVVNFSGNLFTQFPYQLLEIKTLKEIYLGSNKMAALPKSYENLQRLEILYLGGNKLKSVPGELSQLKNLTSLNLSSNELTSLPKNLASLKRIKNLSLQNNNLTTLPIELVRLNLQELSIRNNPLVKRFAKEFSYNVPSLLELSGRVVKSKNVEYGLDKLPKDLVHYLNSAQCCLNPKCKGVYFTSKFEHIKFIDFCGKYRVPFMQYLCSSICNEKISSKKQAGAASEPSLTSDSDDQLEDKLLKKVLLG